VNDEAAFVEKPIKPTLRTNGTVSIFEYLLRYLSMIGLCFWMGGFTFYAAVVIHVGHRVFGSHREIGFLTKEVTVWLNRSGAIVLLILLVNHLYYLGKGPLLVQRIRLGTLLLMAVVQIVLFCLHEKLGQMLYISTHAILDRPNFRFWHHTYVNLSTLQWTGALIQLWSILAAWSASDRNCIPFAENPLSQDQETNGSMKMDNR
jgi:hypothetical protein